MSLQDILQKIIGDAQKQAEEIASEAAAQVEEIQKEALLTLKKEKSALEKSGQSKIDQIHKKVENLGKHERKANILQAKRNILLQTFQKAKEEISHLPNAKKEEVLMNMIQEIEENEGIIHPTEGEEKIVESALKKTKKPFEIGDSVPGRGGFLFITPTSERDFRFDNIVDRELSEKMESEISPLLFTA